MAIVDERSPPALEHAMKERQGPPKAPEGRSAHLVSQRLQGCGSRATAATATATAAAAAAAAAIVEELHARRVLRSKATRSTARAREAATKCV